MSSMPNMCVCGWRDDQCAREQNIDGDTTAHDRRVMHAAIEGSEDALYAFASSEGITLDDAEARIATMRKEHEARERSWVGGIAGALTGIAGALTRSPIRAIEIELQERELDKENRRRLEEKRSTDSVVVGFAKTDALCTTLVRRFPYPRALSRLPLFYDSSYGNDTCDSVCFAIGEQALTVWIDAVDYADRSVDFWDPDAPTTTENKPPPRFSVCRLVDGGGDWIRTPTLKDLVDERQIADGPALFETDDPDALIAYLRGLGGDL